MFLASKSSLEMTGGMLTRLCAMVHPSFGSGVWIREGIDTEEKIFPVEPGWTPTMSKRATFLDDSVEPLWIRISDGEEEDLVGPLELHRTPPPWKINPAYLLKEEEDGDAAVEELEPVEVYCGREHWDGYNDDCYYFGHHMVPARYPLWNFVTRGLSVCNARLWDWNNEGRFCDSRRWTLVYVWFLSRKPHLKPLRGLFRQWARALVWPQYEEIKDDTETKYN